MKTSEPLWTLDELCAQVTLALAVDYAGAVSGRVRDVPDRRTIRYYTTLGLIDRPAAMRGRTALYGRRHLLQLTAIKRLQVRGLALTEVQARLLGATDGVLEKLAEMPAGFVGGADIPVCPVEGTQECLPHRDQREDFWRAAPAPVRPLTAVTLEEGVTLLLEASRPLDEHDLSAPCAAAAPFLKLLRLRRLTSEPEA